MTSNAPFGQRLYSAMASTASDLLLVIGGWSTASGTAKYDTWSSKDGVAWDLGANMPWKTGRFAHTLTADMNTNLLYVSCGITTTSPSSALNDGKPTLMDLYVGE